MLSISSRPRRLPLLIWAIGLGAAAPAVADPAPPVTAFAIPTANAGPRGIAAAPDGSIWFTESAAGKIGKRSPAGLFSEIAIPGPASNPGGIAAAPDGSIWFTESMTNQIGEVTPTGSLLQYALPTAASEPARITIGPDGDPWFTERAGNQIGTVRGGVIAEYPLPNPASEPEGIAASPAGTIRFAEAAAPYVGTITPAGAITQKQLPATVGASAVAADAIGNVWLLQPAASGGAPGVIQFTTGAVPGAYYDVGESFLPPGSNPSAVAIGPDGAAWFAEMGSGQIARLTYTGLGGINHQYDTGGSPQDLVAGPGNSLWFTDPKSNVISRLNLTAPSITSPPAVTLKALRAAEVTVTAGGFPAPALSVTGALPSGLRFADNGNGTAFISGTATTSAAGHAFPVTVTARTGLLRSASQELSLFVAPVSARPRPGTATASLPHISAAVLQVTVACHGRAGRTCSVTAQISGRLHGRRSPTSVIARQTFTLHAGQRRRLRLNLRRALGNVRNGRPALRLVIDQHQPHVDRTVRSQTFPPAPR